MLNPGSLSPESHWLFIIERTLEFGDIDDLRWLKKTFTPEQIASAVKKSRNLSRRTISYCKASDMYLPNNSVEMARAKSGLIL